MSKTSARSLEKQMTMDAYEPLRQGITIIDNKIRNLESRKWRLDYILELSNNGRILNRDQLEAISQYDVVIRNLEMAQELQKQLNTLAFDTTKSLKKQARKEAAKMAHQELRKIKESFLIQGVLENLGIDSIRQDFLQGKSKVQLTQEELKSIDDLYTKLTLNEDEPMAFAHLFHTPTKVMKALLDGADEEAFGTTYAALKQKLLDVASSGYLDTTHPPDKIIEEPIPDIVEVVPETTVLEMTPEEQIAKKMIELLKPENQQPPVRSGGYQSGGRVCTNINRWMKG